MMTMNGSLLSEAKGYFRANKVLNLLVKGFIEKYHSLGRFSGSVKLTNLTKEDKMALRGYFRKSYDGLDEGDSLSISYSKFSKAWENTRFCQLDLNNFLESMSNGELISKQEERDREHRIRQGIMDSMLEEYADGLANKWLKAVKAGEFRLQRKERYFQKDILGEIAYAINNLPTKYECLPIFANRTTGNPHEFDIEDENGRLLLNVLAWLEGVQSPTNVEEKNSILYKYKILRDDINNFVTAYGLLAYIDDKEIAYWRMAADNNSVLNIPLKELVKCDKIEAYYGNKAYIVENSGVFSMLYDVIQNNECKKTFICIHGQPKTSSWVLLDKLHASGTVFYYSGDYDPEGLLIAQQIKNRYPDTIMWHYSIEEYQKTNNSLTNQQLTKLSGIKEDSLIAVADIIGENKTAFYQESIFDALLADLIE